MQLEVTSWKVFFFFFKVISALLGMYIISFHDSSRISYLRMYVAKLHKPRFLKTF